MNQIFDWLRDSISMLHRKNMYDSYWERDMYLAENACIAERDKTIQQMHDIIDEAEAKWEAENTYRCNGNYNDNYKNALKVCPYCGKPIKISEVE